MRVKAHLFEVGVRMHHAGQYGFRLWVCGLVLKLQAHLVEVGVGVRHAGWTEADLQGDAALKVGGSGGGRSEG